MAKNIPTFSILRPFKITQIGTFGLKIYHLATLVLQNTVRQKYYART
jgi:hypothetical protein